MKTLVFILDGEWRKCLQVSELAKEASKNFDVTLITNDANIQLLNKFGISGFKLSPFSTNTINQKFDLAINFSFTDLSISCFTLINADNKIGAGDETATSTIWTKVNYLQQQNKIPFPFFYADVCRNIIGLKREFKVANVELPQILFVNLGITQKTTRAEFIAKTFEFFNQHAELKELIFVDNQNTDLPLKTLKKVSSYRSLPTNELLKMQNTTGIFIGFSDTLSDLLPNDKWSFVFYEDQASSFISPKTGAFVHFTPFIENSRDVLDCFNLLENINAENFVSEKKWYQVTDENLANKRLKLITTNKANLDDIFDQFYYVLWNYVFSLREVSVSPITPTADQNEVLLMTSHAIKKIIELNNFALNELHHIVDFFEKKNTLTQEYQDKINKLGEIDSLTLKVAQNYKHLIPLVYYYHICKAKAQGTELLDIAKELVLVYFEMNQSLQVVNDLIGQTTLTTNPSSVQTRK